MGLEVLAAAVIIAGAGVYQVEQQKEAAQGAENARKEAERKADLTYELQRERDLAEREKEKNLLPPILGNLDKEKPGTSAFIKKTTGVQSGVQSDAVTQTTPVNSGVQ